ncbi:threonine dehydratase [Desulfocucumis palustris]|uniref:L-threonine dehydratase catabolic TdcB n=1 Tax=Desulfocucumis palustris TaxID=1898651 RepID=A0A2L2X9H3_9FIRM|nr:threonine ammonia-lyase [Desulfocucumis palustris]GBF32845.1 threonine dehydratase [Desulfocucumis palustris]
MPDDLLTMDMVNSARQKLRGIIHTTPLDYSALFSRLSGANIYLKLENLQKTGSFKIRGAYNKIAGLSAGERRLGVIAASAGNHAQGVAHAAFRAGIKSVIVMPEGAPLSKIAATQGYGAEVVLYGQGYDDAYGRALEIQRETGAVFIHGFDDPEIMAGQGTIALEIIEQLDGLEAVLVPAGGGGLLAGVAYTVKQLKPGVRVIGVQARGAPAIYLYKKGCGGEEPPAATIADGISVRIPGAMNLEVIKKYVDDMVLVDDDEIAMAILMLLERSKVMAEGAGAAGLAAAIKGLPEIKGLNVAVIISGGNIDVNVLSNIIERGLVESGRRLKIKTILPDRPGNLIKILTLLAELKANIIYINHHRTRPRVPLKQAEVELEMETENKEHLDYIVKSLNKAGYIFEIL